MRAEPQSLECFHIQLLFYCQVTLPHHDRATTRIPEAYQALVQGKPLATEPPCPSTLATLPAQDFGTPGILDDYSAQCRQYERALESAQNKYGESSDEAKLARSKKIEHERTFLQQTRALATAVASDKNGLTPTYTGRQPDPKPGVPEDNKEADIKPVRALHRQGLDNVRLNKKH